MKTLWAGNVLFQQAQTPASCRREARRGPEKARGSPQLEMREQGDADRQEVRRRREGLGMTQEQLAERCGLHRILVGSVERGERNVSILNLRTIARALRVPLADLLGGEAGTGE